VPLRARYGRTATDTTTSELIGITTAAANALINPAIASAATRAL
jgi:hypothetical protein